MWRYWFHGDSIGNRTIIDSHLITVPFRLFHIPSDRSLYNSFDAVSFAMSTILAHSSVSSASEMSAMSPAALDAILVEALPRAYPSRRPTDDMYMLFTSFPRPPPPPQPFLFPSTSIRVMWMLWLRGYDGRPPLDKLRARDLHDDASKRRWWSTKQLFAKLTDVALLMPWVSSKEMLVTGMDLPSFRLMCDEVVALFAYECGSKCTLNADSLCILAATWVTETPYGSMSLTAPSYDRPPRPACTSRPMICDDVTQADEGQLPALPVRTMWPLWHRRDVSQVPYKARTWASGSILAKTRRVMRTLTEIAVETHRVLDEEALERLSTASLYRMFDEVFPVLASRYDVAVQHLVTPDKKCANLVRYQYKTSR
ncbi:hypothetical protein DYB25_010100 [Aphanomyces astaci]|uniref:Uncharacterized protein n=1 Tax=Aphanomyces astaci TaxID=112090 RepID=A0A397D7I6_APHAT|nr:hypothetical protein DYB36_009146 [Aphanomyces astaci]RHY05597.1 hypothetical protein DYB25_010100 [Aphanomyces astaci]RHY40390.1 hypothetical protein DYB34_014047 [Aphanomyces astaci]RHY41260.1 hypothetical protein DYB38_014088 [Aphanomyces astaci]RHY59517.1 hypothetical protein DYB30_014146 [Aphanomyces astaci]